MLKFLNPTLKFHYLNAYSSYPFRFRSSIIPNQNSILTRVVSCCCCSTMAASTKKTTSLSLSDNEQGMSMAKRFWVKFRNESIHALYTPFVVSLASGNLKLETFRNYISQDVHFLKCFVQAFELAEECADDDDDKISISQLRKSVLDELKLHDSFVKEWGFDLAKDNTLNPATVKYTDFLLATASGKVEGVKGPGKLATPFEKTKVAAYTLGAMTPCMRLYAFIGKELQSFLDTSGSSHPYKKWIDNYASKTFEASTLQTEELLEKLSVSLTGEELDIIQKLYHQAMKLEIDFFSAQPIVQKAVVPLLKEHNPSEHRLMVFSDFDLTCTVLDSSAILAEIAIVRAPKSDEGQSQIARMPSADLRNTWGLLSREYTEEYEQCIENILLVGKAEKFKYTDLKKALEQLSKFEKRANTRVMESGVLKGLNLEDIKRAGQRLILQDGCITFFQSITKNEKINAKVHVLSYCWCNDLIKSAFSSGDLHALDIHANELTYDESVTTGEIVRKIESPIDKVELFGNILKDSGSDKKKLIVYIGDSVGDLLCLLEADIGIVIGSSESLRRVGSHFGVSFVPLFPGLVQKQKELVEEEGRSSSCNWTGLSGVLYTVSSWAEIHALIVGS